MQHNFLLIDSVSSSTGSGLARSSRTITEMGHTPRPVISAIDTGTSFYIPADVVMDQIERTFNSWPVAAINIGFVGAPDTQTRIGTWLTQFKKERSVPVVLNPSLSNDNNETDILKRDLLHLADMITPSISEAEKLTGLKIRDINDMHAAAEMLLTLGPRAVFLRGGDFKGQQIIDLLATDTSQITFNSARLTGQSANEKTGYGGVVACVIAVGLAKGQDFQTCVENALLQIKKMHLSEL